MKSDKRENKLFINFLKYIHRTIKVDKMCFFPDIIANYINLLNNHRKTNCTQKIMSKNLEKHTCFPPLQEKVSNQEHGSWDELNHC